jgi:hypothetical protein
MLVFKQLLIFLKICCSTGINFNSQIFFQVKAKDIHVTLRSNLVEVNADRREAIFQNLDKPEILVSKEY